MSLGISNNLFMGLYEVEWTKSQKNKPTSEKYQDFFIIFMSSRNYRIWENKFGEKKVHHSYTLLIRQNTEITAAARIVAFLLL